MNVTRSDSPPDEGIGLACADVGVVDEGEVVVVVGVVVDVVGDVVDVVVDDVVELEVDVEVEVLVGAPGGSASDFPLPGDA